MVDAPLGVPPIKPEAEAETCQILLLIALKKVNGSHTIHLGVLKICRYGWKCFKIIKSMG